MYQISFSFLITFRKSDDFLFVKVELQGRRPYFSRLKAQQPTILLSVCSLFVYQWYTHVIVYMQGLHSYSIEMESKRHATNYEWT